MLQFLNCKVFFNIGVDVTGVAHAPPVTFNRGLPIFLLDLTFQTSAALQILWFNKKTEKQGFYSVSVIYSTYFYLALKIDKNSFSTSNLKPN